MASDLCVPILFDIFSYPAHILDVCVNCCAVLQFVFDGADAEEYEQTFGVAKTEVDDDGEDGGNGIVHQDFLLDNALYSEFNE